MTENMESTAGKLVSRGVVIFEHIPHPRIAERKASGPAKTVDQRTKGKGPLGRLNARFGLFITLVVGTMWCAYVFTLLALVSLPTVIKTHDKVLIVGWIAQTFLQLILLPIIIVGQNVQAAASDQRSEDTYKDAEAVLHEALQIQAHLLAQDAVLGQLVATFAASTKTGEQGASPPDEQR
jgi:hypothetical protein